MRRLIYMSTACRQPNQAMLDRILLDAREYNSKIGVTGILVAHGPKFLQVLEGEPSEVETVMSRVCRSEKHSGIITLVDETVTTRLFPDWSMGYERLGTTQEIEGFQTIANAAARFRESGSQAMASMLDQFFERWAKLPRSVIAEHRQTA